jgi:hypothetical protein
MSASNIDTASIVGKYLSRQTTGTRLNADADTAEENQAILESIAIALLLNPQAILSIILNAKNSMQQLINSDIELIDYVSAAIGETQNPDAFPASTADLVDAQTALVEIDRIGRIDTSSQAYVRYNSSVSNFLNDQLAPLLKRNATGDFNRSGIEAKEDLFNSVSLFTQTHALFIQRLKTLAGAISDYNSVDLSKVVHTQTVARVRTSLQQIKSGMDSGQMSNTVAALELMAGNASLQSISNSKKVYDDTISLAQNLLIGPEPTSAEVESNIGPILPTVTTPTSVTVTVDGGSPASYDLPFTGRSNSPYVCNGISQQTFNVPAGVKLFVNITPGPSPGSDGVTHYAIALTPGPAQLWTNIIADINTVFASSGPIATDFAHSDKAIIIVGSNTDTEIHILPSGPGTFSGSTYTPDAPSAHALLGFLPDQISNPVGSFDIIFLQRFFKANYASTGLVSAITLDDRLSLTSGSTNPAVSSIQVSGATMAIFGFTSAVAVPQAMQLVDSSGAIQDPAALGVLVGSVIHASTFIEDVLNISGLRILFDGSVRLPLTSAAVRVVAPTVAAVQTIMEILGSFEDQFDNDVLPLQGLLSPLLTTPSLAQVNDATRAFKVIRDRLSDGSIGLLDQLTPIVIAEAQEPADAVAQSILQALEERGLDQAQDLMTQCQFSNFFALTSETASKSTSFMKSMENVVTNDLPTTTVEADMPDGNLPAGSNPTSILTNKEVP